MTDIVTRLRDWRNVHLARLHLLMEEAADEMAVLRADNSRRANLEQGLRDAIVRLSANGDCPASDNAARQDNDERLAALQALAGLDEELSLPRRTLATHATPREGREQDGCTLTDAAEVRRLRCAITALADQAATLSVCNGNVTVKMDATLTDDERAAVEWCVEMALNSATDCAAEINTLRFLLERL